VIALLLAALLAAPSKPDLAERIETDLEAWDLQGASRGVDALIQSYPDSAEAAYFQGRVLFEQG
jgi:hypothetical protein